MMTLLVVSMLGDVRANNQTLSELGGDLTCTVRQSCQRTPEQEG
jgi:hypothetical protein